MHKQLQFTIERKDAFFQFTVDAEKIREDELEVIRQRFITQLDKDLIVRHDKFYANNKDVNVWYLNYAIRQLKKQKVIKYTKDEKIINYTRYLDERETEVVKYIKETIDAEKIIQMSRLKQLALKQFPNFPQKNLTKLIGLLKKNNSDQYCVKKMGNEKVTQFEFICLNDQEQSFQVMKT